MPNQISTGGADVAIAKWQISAAWRTHDIFIWIRFYSLDLTAISFDTKVKTMGPII